MVVVELERPGLKTQQPRGVDCLLGGRSVALACCWFDNNNELPRCKREVVIAVSVSTCSESSPVTSMVIDGSERGLRSERTMGVM